MAPIKKNLTIEQGADYTFTVPLLDANLDPIDVTGYAASSQIRKHPSSNSAVSFSTALANGELTLSLSAVASANMSAGRYTYDILITNSANTKIRWQEGIINLTPSVTK